MRLKTVCVVDYHMGNHASVAHSLRELNYRVRVSNDQAVLDEADVLVLPGVGAFPSGMEALHSLSLVSYLQEQARLQRPIIGFCLGMQLLADVSHEYQCTTGLGLIPGEVVPLVNPPWHIGWNSVECVLQDPLFQASDGQVFYFNHSLLIGGHRNIRSVYRGITKLSLLLFAGECSGIAISSREKSGAREEVVERPDFRAVSCLRSV